MPTDIVVPSLGESVSEAVLLRWIKNDGDQVSVDEPLAELETDKANVDLPSKAAGILRQAKKAGDTVKVGETIARIEEGTGAKAPVSVAASAQATPAAPVGTSAPVATKTAETKASAATDDLRPSVRRLVDENKLDPASITPTGPGARIIKEDVVRHLDEQKARGSSGNGAPAVAAPPLPPLAASPRPIPQAAPAPVATTPAPSSALSSLGDFDATGIKRVPMTKIRKRIAERLVQAQQTAAILTTFNEVDMSGVMALRAKYKERFSELYGVPLGFMSFFARAAVVALREFPRVNAFVEGDEVIYHNYVNLGIAVSTDRGLTVPVLQHVETMSFAKIESEIKRLAAAAREGKLGLQELSGATFTITNGGIYGSLLSTPIVSPPESGILGMHAIKERPVAVGGKVEVRPMMYLALSYDHRIVDGRESVSFLVRVKDALEDPARLMLEI
ncbi:MAG TPA: 2-oxoglutarate dehydrogenase complex dihydrolipoyllysine-residue succinyltransferase [Tepidisphaeraceae bacterium]|nr:2-oxoglutarate dehydrogenase complex dihydrolipoyllysine-residue succinyltransferase [Tepidisphaeraceae bacterium]